jgi:hypothetical protein
VSGARACAEWKVEEHPESNERRFIDEVIIII